jgi:hypothetical protein
MRLAITSFIIRYLSWRAHDGFSGRWADGRFSPSEAGALVNTCRLTWTDPFFSKEVAVPIPPRIPNAAGKTAIHQQLRDPLRPSRDPRPKARCTPRLRAQCQTHSVCA